jgi:hypothetical protein
MQHPDAGSPHLSAVVSGLNLPVRTPCQQDDVREPMARSVFYRHVKKMDPGRDLEKRIVKVSVWLLAGVARATNEDHGLPNAHPTTVAEMYILGSSPLIHRQHPA